MDANRLRLGWAAGLALGVALAAGPAARADQAYGGFIQGAFSSPVLAGNYLDVGGQSVFRDSTASAVYSISNGTVSSQLISGDNNGGGGSPSEITFFGNSFSGVAPGQEFALGTLTYNNGASGLFSSIFGATLTLTVAGNAAVTPIDAPFSLVTTLNGGFSIASDADFLSFPAPISLSFHVFEGAGATAIVMGRIVGDPQLQVTGLQLPADQAGNGFLTPVPAPAGVVLLGGGAACLLGVRRRGRNTPKFARSEGQRLT